MSKPPQRLICVADGALAGVVDARHVTVLRDAASGPVLVRRTGNALAVCDRLAGVGSPAWLSCERPALSTAG